MIEALTMLFLNVMCHKQAIGAHLPLLDSARIESLRDAAIAGNDDSAFVLATNHPPIGKELWLTDIERSFWLIRLASKGSVAGLNLEYMFHASSKKIRQLILNEMKCPDDSLLMRMYRSRLKAVGNEDRFYESCKVTGAKSL